MPEDITEHSLSAGSTAGENFSFRQFSDSLIRKINCAEVLLLTTLPRGGLQIAQPQRVPDSLTKGYVREWHTEDDVSWQAIRNGTAVQGKPGNRFIDDFLKPFGYEHVAAAPVGDPVLPGYIGVLQLLRTAEQGEFTAGDLHQLNAAAEQLSASLADARSARASSGRVTPLDTQPTDVREFVLNEKGECILFEKAFHKLDESVRLQLAHEATDRLLALDGQPTTTNRLTLPDSNGDQWTINAIAYRKFPALSTGPVVFFTLLPSCPDWGRLRTTDLHADAEMSRLVSSMHFMQQEYSRGPTLTEIARTVHLSPFHFHRRFTELFGLTPKHFLLECQIHDAKSQLLAGEKELSKIAADCGFAHQSHFTSRFKQATGLTPTRWRRMAAANAN